MKKINILLIAICAIFVVSCKDFLDVKPSQYASSESSISSPADAQVFLNGIMRRMSSTIYYGRNMFMYADIKGGDLAICSQGRGLDGLYAFNQNANSSYSDYWNHIYDLLLQANTLIQNVDKMIPSFTGTTLNNLNNYKGQALTLRAMMYFDLVRLYGKPYNFDKSSYGVPVVTEPVEASAQPTRASVEEVYTQIVKDLKEAESLLVKTRTNGFINYYGNIALQARVYLYMERYAESLAAAETIINSNVYTLYTNANWVSSWRSRNGSESIFELAVLAGEGDPTTGSMGIYLRRRLHGNSSAMGMYMASDQFLARLGEDPSDVRWGVMSYDEISNTRLGASYKWCGSVNLDGDGQGNSTAVNIKVIRLSEMYLLAAEAALGSNNKAKAVTYLNRIRQRAPGLDPATEATINLDMIADERSKELFTEGHRFFDMIRWNKSITYNDDLIFPAVTIPHRPITIDRTFYKTVLPISQAEMDANPAIKAQQNPGY